MRKRDILGCWQQLLTLLGTSAFSEKDWVKVYRNFIRSWNRTYYLKLYESHDIAADVVSAPGRHRYTMAPVSGPSVSLIKRRNSLAMPSAPSVHRTKRRNSLVPSSAPSIHPIKRRNSLVPPSAPSIHPIKRRKSLVLPSVPSTHPTKSLYSKGQICETLLKTAKRKNSVAAPDFDINGHTDLLLNPIKRSDSDELNSSMKRRDSMALDQWTKPIQLISPLAPSPITHQNSLSLDLGLNRKESVCPLSPTRIKRRNSVVSVPPMLKSKSSLPKPLQKPISVVKHVTGSSDELDDEMSLSVWKEFSARRKAIKTKPLGSPANGIPPQECPKQVKVEPPVKRKRGRPSREEKAKRLEEEQALKMHQAVAPLKEPSMKKMKMNEEYEDLDLDQKSCKNATATQPIDARKKQRKTASQSNTKSLSHEPTKSHKYSEPPKQKPTAKPRCQSTSSISDQEGSDIAINSNDLILDEDAMPKAHMPANALDLKSAPKIPGDKEGKRPDTEGEGKEEDKVRPKSKSTANGYSSKNGRSTFNRIIGSLSSDEEEDEQLLLQQTGFVFNDLEEEEQLLDYVMELTSPVGGVEGDKDVEEQPIDTARDLTSKIGGENDNNDALINDIDLDHLLSEKTVANQIALIDPQPEISFNQCQEAIDNSETNDKCLETLSSERSASANDHQLTHTSEFFEKLSSRPPVDPNADKSNLLWPFMDDDEVLDYEPDYDVLTLVVSSDELEDECLSKSKKESKKTESEPQNQISTPNVQVKSPNPELLPKPIDKPGSPNANGLRGFRIPRITPELLKAQPSVMHSLYLQEDGEQQIREQVKTVDPPFSEEVRKKREEAIAARRPKETTPQFAPPYRHTHKEESVPQDFSLPIFGLQNMASPLFGPDDLAPIFLPPSNMEESNYPHPHEESQYARVPFGPNCSSLINRNFLPEVQPQQHPTEVSQYMPQNLATRERNTRPAEVSPPRYQGLGAKHWMMEIFGAKCLRYLDNKCLAANCDHAMSPVGEVERRLLSMPEESLVHIYRQALRSFYIFEKFFKCFANIFERRKLYKHLLQMLANSRLYRNLTVAIINHVFPALKRSGLEREATRCIMTDLWMPDKAHKFRELTLAILNILEGTNWQDYIHQLMELHDKYKFLLSEEFMIRIMKWADVTKNEDLQIKACGMLFAGIETYGRSPTLKSLLERFFNPDSNSNHPRKSPAQQQQYTTSNLKDNTEPNQIPSLIPQQDPLPGAGSNPSLIRNTPASRQPPQYWNFNPNTNPNFAPQQERLPGAGPGPSLIGSNLVYKPHWNLHNPNPTHFRDLPGASANFAPQHERLPEAGPGPSLISSNLVHKPHWNPHNPNPNHFRDLPGASAGPSLIRSNPLVGQHQEQQHHSASTWRSQADKVNSADSYSSFPAGFQ